MNLFLLKNLSFKELKHKGIDSIDKCINKTHFLNYNKNISYLYNSRGFRDNEWPIDIENKIWCIGDSFTEGLGQPVNETWPKILEKQLNETCINVSENGCSNDLISLRIDYIKKNFNPKCIIVMWSYFWRRFKDGINVQFNKTKKELPADDLKNFIKNFNFANDNSPYKIINYLLPECMIKDTSAKRSKKNIIKLIKYHYPENNFYNLTEVEQVDFGRDGYHFGLLTCEKIVEDILTKY